MFAFSRLIGATCLIWTLACAGRGVRQDEIGPTPGKYTVEVRNDSYRAATVYGYRSGYRLRSPLAGDS